MKSIWTALLITGLVVPACKKDEKKKTEPAAEKKVETPPVPVKPAETPPPVDPALLERGEYLANVMGCEQCHTSFGPNGPDQSKRWAGGLEAPEVFGTWRSPNITQDKETGIGAWTDEQIIVAIREGKRPDGEQLFPIMPYLGYNVMSDDDAKALVAFLRTIEPISNKVERATDLKLPKIPAPPAKGLPPSTDDPVAHGAYLTSLMHCVICHTPMSEQGPDMSKAFAGGQAMELPMFGEGALYTANLTPDPKTGIGNWKDEELVAAIMQMKKRDGSMIMGPMAMYQGGWSQMPEKDVKDIVAFLRSLPPVVNKVPKSTFKPKAPPPGAAPGAAPGEAPAAAPGEAPAEPAKN